MKKQYLIILSGCSGTGKSTVAFWIREQFGAIVLRSDEIRKELFGVPKYSDEETRMVYDTLFLRARKSIGEGKLVVLDATFNKKQNRELARELAKYLDIGYFLIETVCPEDIVKTRLENRTDDISQAKFEHFLQQQKQFELIEEEHLVLDTAGDWRRVLSDHMIAYFQKETY